MGLDMFLTVNGNEEIYWRKVNSIHHWFVANVQEGVDDCSSYEVSRNDLLSLQESVEQVINNPELASEVLPTSSGFFFGSTDYDEWYFDDLKITLKNLKDVLDKYDDEDIYHYSAWW